ncbi:MAG: UDP-N-acetylglucosamine 2-epimerase (non-hydrolyzing) [Bacteroidetes bacterium]|nr:UDP-N-acetylglucosamine 2-epimerase (non-hydrolyzing) [Bacteroidota bacterium]
MKKKKIISVVGARPNFMKIAPIYKAFKNYSDVEHRLCHTGQHYDEKMSKIFFEELELPKPDFYLGVSAGTMTEQTANIMIEFEKVILSEKPDLVIVVGDVTSTIACSLVAQRHGIPKAHVEAGLRSFDRTMPEEINRILTDSISDYLFVTEQSGVVNLKNEGVPEEKIFFTGNVMIDSLMQYIEKAKHSTILEQLKLQPQQYTLVTLHRPRNVDSVEELKNIVSMLNALAKKSNIVFPVHPRTRKNLESAQLLQQFDDGIIITEPIGYIDFLSLIQHALLIITDSGGIQEETTFLGVQCLTARDNTERPSTVELGTNQLIGTNWDSIYDASLQVLSGNKKSGTIPELWDGKAAERIAKILHQKLLY